MAEQTKSIKIDVKDNFKKTEGNAKKMNKTFFDTKSAINDVLKSGDSFEKKLKAIDKIVKETPLNVRDMNKQIQAYQSIALSAGRETPVGKQALKQAADLRDRYIDIQNETKRLADDQKNLQGVIQLVGTGIAGFGAIQSAMALTGNQSEELRETMTKILAAQTLLNSVNQIATALEKESSAMLLLKSIRTKVLASSLYAYATAQGVATKGVKLFRLALASSGIGLIVIAIGLLIANFSSLLKIFKPVIDGFKAIGDAIGLSNFAAEERFQADQKRHEQTIANAEKEIKLIDKLISKEKERQSQLDEIFATRLKQAKGNDKLTEELEAKRLKSRKDSIDEEERLFLKQQEAVRDKLQASLEKQQGLIDKAYRKRVRVSDRAYEVQAQLEERITELNRQLREKDFTNIIDFNIRRENLDIDFNQREEERRKKRADKYKSYLQDRLNAQRKIEDIENALREEGIDKELEINKDKFRRLIEDTKRNTKLTREERNKLIALYEEQGQQQAEDIRNKYALKELQAERKRQEDIANQENAFLDELAAIEEANYQRTLSDQDRELLAVQDKYFRLETLAQDNAEALNEIEIARLNEENEINLKYQNERDALDAELKQKQIDRENKLRETRLSLTASAFDALSGLVGAFNANNEKDAKKQFKITKALNLASAVTNTALAVTGALTAGGNPIKLATGTQFVEAGIAGAVGLANIAKIASSKFGGGDTGGGASAPSGAGAISSPQAPSFNIVGNNNINQLAELQGQPTKAYVVSDEVTSAQALDRKAQDFATL